MSFRPSRYYVALRILVQILSVICLLAVINDIAFHYYRQIDCSRSHRFSLSDQGSVLFTGIKQPAHIIIYFSPTSLTQGAELYGDVEALMKEYKIKARENLIIEYLDPARELGRAREVQGKYKFDPNENVIVIDYLDHSAVIPVKELGEYDDSKVAPGEPPRLVAFRGEQVINAALIGLSGVPTKKVYFLQGHGEAIPNQPPLQIIGRYLEYQNIIPGLLNLAETLEVPNDAALLLIDGPHVDFSEAEIEALKNYWKHSGRFFILLDPTADTPLLNHMLEEIGITPCLDRVIRLTSTENFKYSFNSQESATVSSSEPLDSSKGELTKKQQANEVNGYNSNSVLHDVTGEFIPGCELTKQFLGLNILLLGTTQSLVLKASDSEMQFRPLIQAARGFSSSHGADGEEKSASSISEQNAVYPVVIAAMADRGALHDDRVALNASRMVVVGNSDFINDKAIGEVGLDFFSSVLNGLIDRVQLTGNTAKMKIFLTLNLDREEMKKIALWCIIIIPGLAALLGIIFIWRRRV